MRFTELRGLSAFRPLGCCTVLFVAAMALPQPAVQADAETAEIKPGDVQPSAGTPKFRCDQTTYEFPETWAGDKVEHTFVVHNDGTAPLEILEVKPGCGCTVAKDYDKVIAPGASGKIPFTLNTGMNTAKLTKPITVRTNDPANASVTLTLTGQVKARISIEPPTGAQFGRVTEESELSRVVKVVNNTDKMMKLAPVAGHPTAPFKAEVKELVDGKEFEVTITAERPFNQGMNAAQLNFSTGIEGTPPVLISANLYAPPILEIQPNQIMLIRPPITDTPSNISLVYNGSGEMKVLNVESSDEALKTDVQPGQPEGRSYNVVVTVPKGYTLATGESASITITTDLKEFESIVVPVRMATTQARPESPLAGRVQPEQLLGRPAPSANLTTPLGSQMLVGGNNGKVSVVNFWSTWCGECRRQLPLLQRVSAIYRRRNVEFVNVCLDQLRPTNEIIEIAKEIGINMPVAFDTDQTLATQYGATALPLLVVIDAEGIVQAVHRGLGPDFDNALESQLDTLLAGGTRNEFKHRPFLPGQYSLHTSLLSGKVTPPAGASLEMDSMRQDVGAYKPGESGSYRLYFRNRGSAPLTFTEVTASEGLAITWDKTKEVPAGSVASFEAKFTAPKQPGPFGYSLKLMSNDPARPQVVASLIGTAKPYIELDPPSGMDLGRKVNMPSMATLIYNGEGKITYLGAESSLPQFKPEVQLIREGPHAIVTVYPNPPFQLGENKGVITVKTDCKEQPVVEVPVRAYQPPRIEVDPPAISYMPNPRLQRLQVSITNNGEGSLSITGVKASDSAIKWQFFPEPDGATYRLYVTLPPNFKAGNDSSVTVMTTDKEMPEIVIPIRLGGPGAVSSIGGH